MSPSALILGRYQLQDLIAAGGMGEVWRAVDIVLERPVAIKRLRADSARQAEAVARFRREARQAGSVCHPAVASVYDFADAGPSHPPYLVMELVDGPSLAAVLSAGPLDPARAMDVIAQAAAGLHAAHLAGVVHRDVKPANLLFDRHGHVKVTDFGIAHTVGFAPAPGTDMIVGTPPYLAPERAARSARGPCRRCVFPRHRGLRVPDRPPSLHRDTRWPSCAHTAIFRCRRCRAPFPPRWPRWSPSSRPRTRPAARPPRARPPTGRPGCATPFPAWCHRRTAPQADVVDPTLTEIPGPGVPAGSPGRRRERGRLARPAASTRRRRGCAGRPAGHARRRNTDHGQGAPALRCRRRRGRSGSAQARSSENRSPSRTASCAGSVWSCECTGSRPASNPPGPWCPCGRAGKRGWGAWSR